MRWVYAAATVLIILLAVGILFSRRAEAPSPVSMNLTLTSSTFEPNGLIPSKFTCDGANVSPELSISGVPASAKTFALIMDDPDIPESVKQSRGIEKFDHWVVFNIPPDTREVPEGVEPVGTPGNNGRGAVGYTGPCPPDREHRYFFKLYALDAALDLPAGASKVEVERAMEGHVIGRTELVGRYDRKR